MVSQVDKESAIKKQINDLFVVSRSNKRNIIFLLHMLLVFFFK